MILKKHWKKLTILSTLTYFGADYLIEQYRINKHMKQICLAASNSNTIQTAHRNLLIVINPIAGNKDSEKLFRQYCEPILHLAGFSVDVFKTQHSGHVKGYIENIEKLPDAIIVAGGNGTASEVVTGLLRRSSADCAVAFLPLGQRNRAYFTANKLNNVKALTNALDAVISGSVRHKHAMQFNVISSKAEDKNTELKPIFGMNEFSWGILNDVISAKKKYWLLGPLSYYAAAFTKCLATHQLWDYEAEFLFADQVAQLKRNQGFSFLPNITFFEKATQQIEKDREIIGVSNTTLGNRTTTNQLYITLDDDHLCCKFLNYITPSWDFIKTLPRNYLDLNESNVVLKAKSLTVNPLNESSRTYFSIDGEEYEALPIQISLSTKRVKTFE